MIFFGYASPAALFFQKKLKKMLQPAATRLEETVATRETHLESET